MAFNRRVFLGSTAAGLAGFGLSRPAFATPDPIRIGVPTALTGPYADLGDQAKRAITFAVDEANAAGGIDGRNVEVRMLDTQAKADLARQQGEKLALGGYNLMIGAPASGEALAMGPMLARWDALYMSTINKADEITGASCQPRLFRVNRQDAADAAAIKPWLANRPEKKWALVAADIAWGHGSGARFKQAVEATGKAMVSEAYTPFGTNDYAPYIQAIKNSGADGLWVLLAGRDAITFTTQAAQFGLLDKLTVSGISYMTDNNARAVGAISKGIWGVINYSSTLGNPANNRFVADWAKKYSGSAPSNFEGDTYIGMQVILQAVAKAKSVAPGDVAKAMAGTTFDTILGKQLMRKEDHQLVGPNFFGQIKEVNGVLRPVVEMTIPADVATPPPDGTCKSLAAG